MSKASSKLTRYKRGGDFSYTLGAAVTIELLLHAPECADKIFISPAAEDGEGLDRIRTLCGKNSVAIETDGKAFNILSPKGNCFVIGVFRKFKREIEKGSHIVLVNPSDSGNLGTIIRTAVGFSFTDLAVVRPATDIFDPKTVRASMGALFSIRFEYFDAFCEYRKKFPENFLYPFILKKESLPISEASFEKPFSLIFGNEATGLPDGFEKLDGKTQPVIIPHSASIDSLNLPVAAAIGMFEAAKKRFPR